MMLAKLSTTELIELHTSMQALNIENKIKKLTRGVMSTHMANIDTCIEQIACIKLLLNSVVEHSLMNAFPTSTGKRDVVALMDMIKRVVHKKVSNVTDDEDIDEVTAKLRSL
jgi:hypothetical protein